jgi:conjugative relaxase-like TrwC/TraI family protein
VGSSLTIRAAKNPGYYEQAEFARDDYYTERNAVPGEWIGRGAELLQLQGAPERGQLGTLLAGKEPRSGGPLPGGRGRRPSNAGFDLTFTAPKSVSVMLAIGDERMREAVLAAHDRGVRAGLDYLERHECFARRGKDGVDVIPALGFAGAAYPHEMARSGDPHLHTHVVIANRVLADDGRWTAPDMRPVYAAAKTAGTIAESVLREELTRSLGVRWQDVRNGTAEIDGIPRAVLEHFSQRHSEIVELAGARGWLNERGIEEIQRETRDRKPQIDRDQAQAQWRARAAEQGLTVGDLDKVTGKRRTRRPPAYARNLRRRLAGPNGLTRQESTFTRRALIQASAEAYPEGLPADELERRADTFLKADGVRVTERVGHEPERHTTLDMLRTEVRLLELVTADVRRPATARADSVKRALADLSGLGKDQAEAVRYLTAGKSRTRLLEARAGYGKTKTLQALRDAYARDGIDIIGTSWGGQAAQNLQRESGIPSATTARILNQLARDEQPIPDGAVVVVDEAGMMPTRALTELAEEVAYREGRLILVGDRDQLPPIDAGGAFASIADRLGAARLEENRRQRDELQRTVADRLAEGRASDALALLEEHGRFQSYDDARNARTDLIDTWAETSLEAPDSSLILAYERRDVATLNLMARERMDDADKLGRARLDAYGREWATGDRLLCRRNDYREGIDVRNGTRGTVTKVDRVRSVIQIRTDDGRTVKLPADYLEHVDYGYASTGHASQGMSVDRTFLLATPARGGREWGYVAGTRHRIDLRVYTVSQDAAEARSELQRTWQRSQAKALALDRMTAQERRRALGRADRILEKEERARERQERDDRDRRDRDDRGRDDDEDRSR